MTPPRQSIHPLVLERHLAVGQGALARGWLDALTYGRIMLEAGQLGGERFDEALWMGPGRLTEGQMVALV
ncbi:MAG: hypothetical protein EOO70_09795, partial [Myxococcaceae bacterium]